MYDPYAEFEKNTLPNGLEVHSVFWDRPWVVVEIVVHSGGREDPVALPGLAHFVEHLVSENIPERTSESAREFFDNCGGSAMFGSTSYLSTRYKFKVPSEKKIFQEALRIFGSMMLQEKLDHCIERERSVIHQEFNGYYPVPEDLTWILETQAALFKGHKLETWNCPLGRPEGFLSATKEDLQGFYDKHYVPKNISLVVVGGIATQELLQELQQSPFGVQKDGARNPVLAPLNPIPIPTHHEKWVCLSEYVKVLANQTRYEAAWVFPEGISYQARTIFCQILDRTLFKEIREKRKLAYSIGSNYQSFQDVCKFYVTGRVSSAATHTINDLVRDCITQAALDRDLFNRKLESAKQKCLMVDTSGSGLAKNSAGDLARMQRIETMQDDFNNLNLVTFEQMADIATLLSSEQQYTRILYP